jgi:ATP-dependent Clp protease ATP-binding subunit ClpC
MLERFTVLARQSLFFARRKADERNGDEIATQDLLGGLMMAAPNGVLRFASQDAEILRPAVTREQMLRRMRDEHGAGGGMNARMEREIPFSASVKVALVWAVREADDLRHRFIRPEHLLLSLLREEDTDEWPSSISLTELGYAETKLGRSRETIDVDVSDALSHRAL